MTDWPCISFSDELIAAYPDAKVILTVRDTPEVWLDSILNTIWGTRHILAPPTNLPERILQTVIPKPSGWRAVRKLFIHSFLRDAPNKGIQGYIDHNAHIRAIAPKNKFLEFNVKEGWGPLCGFLELEEPDMPFPRVNDSKAFQNYIRGTQKETGMILLANIAKWSCAVGVAGLAIWFGMG